MVFIITNKIHREIARVAQTALEFTQGFELPICRELPWVGIQQMTTKCLPLAPSLLPSPACSQFGQVILSISPSQVDLFMFFLGFTLLLKFL